VLHTEGKFYQQNADGTWSEAVPLPLYGLKKRCDCGKSFWKEKNYYRHYQQKHTDGMAYQRTPSGLIAIDRRFQ